MILVLIAGVFVVVIVGTVALAAWGSSLREPDPFSLPPVRIADARDGQRVRVLGRITRAQTLVGPFGEPVVAFELDIREPGRSKRAGYARVLREAEAGPFVLEDGSARAAIDTTHVEVVPAPGTPFLALDARVEALLDRRGRHGRAWRSLLRQRYVSAQEGDQVSLVGRCRRNAGAYRAGAAILLEPCGEEPIHLRIERRPTK